MTESADVDALLDSSGSPNLCFTCRQIPIRLFQPDEGETVYIDHHRSYDALKAHADHGCPLCKLFLSVAGPDGNAQGIADRGSSLYSDDNGCVSLYFGVKIGFVKGAIMPNRWSTYKEYLMTAVLR